MSYLSPIGRPSVVLWRRHSPSWRPLFRNQAARRTVCVLTGKERLFIQPSFTRMLRGCFLVWDSLKRCINSCVSHALILWNTHYDCTWTSHHNHSYMLEVETMGVNKQTTNASFQHMIPVSSRSPPAASTNEHDSEIAYKTYVPNLLCLHRCACTTLKINIGMANISRSISVKLT